MIKSKQLLSGVAAAALMVAFTVSAEVRAADLGAAPAPTYIAEPSPDWAGPYLGGHVGYGQATYEGYDSAGCCIDAKPNGFLVGLHAGYNWQNGDFVYGVEGDVTATPGWAEGESTSGNPYSGIWGELGGVASLRARLGMAFNDSLVYATGGVAFASSAGIGCSTTGFCASQASPQVTVGGVAGGGIEWKVRPDLSWRVEGLYYIFDQDEREPSSSGHAGIQNAWVGRIGASWHY